MLASWSVERAQGALSLALSLEVWRSAVAARLATQASFYPVRPPLVLAVLALRQLAVGVVGLLAPLLPRLAARLAPLAWVHQMRPLLLLLVAVRLR